MMSIPIKMESLSVASLGKLFQVDIITLGILAQVCCFFLPVALSVLGCKMFDRV